MNTSPKGQQLRLRSELSAWEIMELIDHRFDEMLENKRELLAFCPLHGESTHRTLTVHKRDKLFRCSERTCPGNRGGDLIELFALSRDVTREEAEEALWLHVSERESDYKPLAERVSLRPSEIRSQVSPAMAWRLAVALMLIVAVMMWIQIESGLGEPRRWSVGPFSEARTHCEITDAMLTEVSGMIASRLHPGDLWVHEDSRGDQNLYRLGPNGHVAQTVEVTGFMAQDVEDIAFGPLPDGSMHGIFLADAGDGGADRQVWNLVVLDERDLEGGDAVAPVRVVPVRWPGDVVNGEALVVSPRTGDVYVIEKTAERRPARLYRIARDVWANAEGEAMAQPVGEFDLRRIEAEQSTAISAAEINADGTEIALRTPHFIYVFPLGENLLETLRTEEPLALLLAAHEPKGEALCYDREGRDLFTASEKSLTISRYVREDANSE